MNTSILSPAFLFRFTVPCRKAKQLKLSGHGQPDAKHQLPFFGQLEGQPAYADVAAAWHETGLTFQVRVRGKKQQPWCRGSRLEDSDGIQLLVDTRDAHNIHRASRFCHRFIFTPLGSGAGFKRPTAALVAINRAREAPKEIADGSLQIDSQVHADGYSMQLQIPGECLTGYNPADHPRLGFSYAISDRELGWQTFSVGSEFPVLEDPSLWGTLTLDS